MSSHVAWRALHTSSSWEGMSVTGLPASNPTSDTVHLYSCLVSHCRARMLCACSSCTKFVLPGVDVGLRPCEELLAGNRGVHMEAYLGGGRGIGF